MFGRRSQSDSTDSVQPDASAAGPGIAPAQAPKGRPTPSRKDAEAQRKQALKNPADPKAAKKAMKARQREERMDARAGLMSGDERYFPARDRGPAKAFTRDFIDGKRRLSEFFLFLAVGILLAGLVQSPEVKGVVSLLWFVIFGLVILDVTWALYSLNRQLKQKFPDKADRKGCTFYAAMRLMQIRRLRIPPPRVRPGGQPVQTRQK
jgi:hypothetical protein